MKLARAQTGMLVHSWKYYKKNFTLKFVIVHPLALSSLFTFHVSRFAIIHRHYQDKGEETFQP